MAGRIGSVQRAQADVRPKAAALAARNDVHTLAAMDEWADELIRRNRMLLQRAEEERTAEIARRPTARRGVNRHAQLNWYRDYQNWLARHAWETPSGSDRPEPSSAG